MRKPTKIYLFVGFYNDLAITIFGFSKQSLVLERSRNSWLKHANYFLSILTSGSFFFVIFLSRIFPRECRRAASLFYFRKNGFFRSFFATDNCSDRIVHTTTKYVISDVRNDGSDVTPKCEINNCRLLYCGLWVMIKLLVEVA